MIVRGNGECALCPPEHFDTRNVFAYADRRRPALQHSKTPPKSHFRKCVFSRWRPRWRLSARGQLNYVTFDQRKASEVSNPMFSGAGNSNANVRKQLD